MSEEKIKAFLQKRAPELSEFFLALFEHFKIERTPK